MQKEDFEVGFRLPLARSSVIVLGQHDAVFIFGCASREQALHDLQEDWSDSFVCGADGKAVHLETWISIDWPKVNKGQLTKVS